MNIDTSTFSPPRSQRTREGSLNSCTASLNNLSTASAWLLFEHRRYTGILEYPSTAPWVTIFHLY